jgi:hypothetical protein
VRVDEARRAESQSRDLEVDALGCTFPQQALEHIGDRIGVLPGREPERHVRFRDARDDRLLNDR